MKDQLASLHVTSVKSKGREMYNDVRTPIPAKAVKKKLRDLPNRTGIRVRKYLNSNQLCGPAKRNTVMIETCRGSQVEKTTETTVHKTSENTNTLVRELVKLPLPVLQEEILMCSVVCTISILHLWSIF